MKKEKLPDLGPATQPVSAVIHQGALSTTQDFHLAVEQAQVEGEDSLEVTEELFKKLFHHVYKEPTQMCVTYGNPGIKVYREGKREECEKREKMTAEVLADYLGKQRMV